uniref:MSLNL protein n=1 Tax=Falco tinnunculus TaxID=100819 RepID=A0A8C4USN6_FALTI
VPMRNPGRPQDAAVPGSLGFAGSSTQALQSFQCIPASDLPAADILAFPLSAQLSCLARLLAARNLTADFGQYPPDLLLFFDLTEVRGGTCGAFYARASRGNLDLLPRGSARRTGLLRGALACLGVRSSHLRPEQLNSLGALVCDMEPETIVASDPSVLENLKLCPALTGAQRDALNAVLLGGGTAYGDPSSWDLQTLQNLGPLVLALNQTTLNLVAEVSFKSKPGGSAGTAAHRGVPPGRESEAGAGDSGTGQEPPRRPPVSMGTLRDGQDLLCCIASCRDEGAQAGSLHPFLPSFPFPDPLFCPAGLTLQIYPSGIPEEQLKLLGPLSRQYTVQEISLWPVTSSDTLSALVQPLDFVSQVQQLLSRYLTLGGTLTGPLLQKIGGRHLSLTCDFPCPRTAGQLNISSCSQTKKDQLYRKARVAFAGQAGTRAYYCRIWPYLGRCSSLCPPSHGAWGSISLPWPGGLKLSVVDVKNLLGENLPSLKEAENETSVMRWVKRQSQRELDCTLGIGLQGGTEEPGPTRTAPPPHPTASASITPTATIPVPTTLPTVAISSPPPTNSSTSPHKAPTPSALSPAPPKSTPPNAYTTARPALTTSSIIPCSIHQSATSHKATPSSVKPNATSPSSVPLPALTRSATTSASAGTTPNTSTPLVSMNPPAPGGTTHPTPATRHTVMPSTLVPNSTSATAATETNLPSHKPTPTPNSTVSTQKSVTSSTTTLLCKTGAPPALLGPSSTTHSSETTKKPPVDVPEPPRPTPGGYINLQPEAGKV